MLRRFYAAAVALALVFALSNIGVSHSHADDADTETKSDAKPAAKADSDTKTKSEEAEEESQFTIGSPAPALDIEHWVSDRNGDFGQVTELEKGKVYVVEFWATWCGPCIASMPEIVDLQNEFIDKGVQIISISDEDLDTVTSFLEREVAGKDMTYGELTSSYCLTTDPDESVKNDYFRAAGQRGIPCAFVVGKTGLVEWIGHPMSMKEPLQLIVDDSWDREAFGAKFKAQQEAQRKRMLVQAELSKTFGKAMAKFRNDDIDGGVEILDELISDDKFDVFREQLITMKVNLLIEAGDERAVDAFRQNAEAKEDDPKKLNEMSWGIYELAKKGDVSEALIAEAIKTMRIAIEKSPEDGPILDTLAHLLYVGGELDEAIEVQEKAVQFAGSMKAELTEFLDELNEEKEAKSDKDTDDDSKEEDGK